MTYNAISSLIPLKDVSDRNGLLMLIIRMVSLLVKRVLDVVYKHK